MRSSILFFFVILTANLQLAYVEALVNGSVALSGTYPFMLELMTEGEKHVCLASLLDKKNALTAARCLQGFSSGTDKPGLKLRGGGLLLKETSRQPFYQIRNVQKFFVHPNYVSGKMENDLAILKIENPFMISIDIQEFPRELVSPDRGRCAFASWVNEKGELSRLRYVDLYVMDDCPGAIANTFCAHKPEGDYTGLCEGDYGGAILCAGKLSGIFIGPPESCQGKPPLFTDISKFEDWTLDTLYGAEE